MRKSNDRSRISTFLLLSALAASACSGASDADSTGGPIGANGDPVELDDFAELVARTTCARVFDCCSDDEVATHFGGSGFGGFDSMEGCVSVYQGFTEALAIPSVRMSIDRGYLAYDAKAMGGCLDEFAAAACTDLDLVGDSDTDDECPGGFVPLQDAGDPCLSDTDCIGGVCESADGGEGTCAPLPKASESCTFACAEPLRCGADADGQRRCLPRLSLGESCSSGDDCESRQCRGEFGAMTCQDERACQGK